MAMLNIWKNVSYMTRVSPAYRVAPIDLGSSALCVRCSLMNLNYALQWIPTPEYMITHNNSTLPFEKSCAFCQILLQLGNGPNEPNQPIEVGLTKVAVKDDDSEHHVLGFRIWPGGRQGTHFYEVIPGREKLSESSGGPLLKEFIDYARISSWIRKCQTEHISADAAAYVHCTTVRHSEVPFLMVLDCKTRKIVPGKANRLYVALSYVWGRGSILPVIESISLNSLPTTIEDAITVTQNLGFRYLWVDRYCIDQRKPDQVKHQVKMMNHIYQGAELVIIAAAGEDPFHGLPGVGTRQRLPYHVGSVGELTLLRPLPNSRHTIDTSKWNSRGWTFQEVMFSRRRLVFTDYEAYFECGSFGSLESQTIHLQRDANVWLETRQIRKRPQHDLGYDDGILPHNLFATDVDVFGCIQEYASRAFTHQSDALNAILGVFQSFQEHRGLLHCWGIPVLPTNPMSTLIRGLLWKSRLDRSSSQCLRRIEFPSWSWAGWQFPGRDLENDLNWSPHPFTSNLVSSTMFGRASQVRIELENGHIVSCAEFVELSAPGCSRYLTITAWVVKVSNLWQVQSNVLQGWYGEYSGWYLHPSQFDLTQKNVVYIILAEEPDGSAACLLARTITNDEVERIGTVTMPKSVLASSELQEAKTWKTIRLR